MSSFLKLRFGISNDPTAMQPSLKDCLEAVLQRSGVLMGEVLAGLRASGRRASGRLVGLKNAAGLRHAGAQQAIGELAAKSTAVCGSFQAELQRTVYEGHGREPSGAQLLHFEDLHLFEDADLNQSIEIARAQQEVVLAVDDVLPDLDALMSTLVGWRTVQPGLNPLRPDVFVRALQACLEQHVPSTEVREMLIAPAVGVLGVNLRKLYRELSRWLRSCGVEAAVPIGGKTRKPSAPGMSGVADSVAKTLLTLEKLRKLLAGSQDPQSNAGPKDFLYTIPASMVALQDLRQVDAMVQRLETRPEPEAAPQPPEAQPTAREKKHYQPLGKQLGDAVVRLMFDNLRQDERLLPALRTQLEAFEPVILTLARQDSRFFSDRQHPARQFLDRVAQRSLAFTSEADQGCRRFLESVEEAMLSLASEPAVASVFAAKLEELESRWNQQDETLRQRSDEAARTLLHAEQRYLLAQRLGAHFCAVLEGLDVADFVAAFLQGPWAQVVAQSQLAAAADGGDPQGYLALADELIFSVRRSAAGQDRGRLAQMIPDLVAKLGEGLDSIDYPFELSSRFLDGLATLHRALLKEGEAEAAEPPAEAGQPEAAPAEEPDSAAVWLAHREAAESGYLPEDSVMPQEPDEADLATPPEPARTGVLSTGAWIELQLQGQWIRVQLTWASPQGTLFMFTSLSGSAHSMSRRTMDRLRTQGLIRVVSDRHVVDQALDQVAQTALKNSLDKQG